MQTGRSEQEQGASGILSEEEFRSLFAEVRTWQRWGAEDQGGGLNLLSQERVSAAAREVRVVPDVGSTSSPTGDARPER